MKSLTARPMAGWLQYIHAEWTPRPPFSSHSLVALYATVVLPGGVKPKAAPIPTSGILIVPVGV